MRPAAGAFHRIHRIIYTVILNRCRTTFIYIIEHHRNYKQFKRIKIMNTNEMTLAQAAAIIEENGQQVKVGNFESFGDFVNYFDCHYRPMLERINNGEDISTDDRHLLNFLASDLLAAFKTEDSESEEPTADPLADIISEALKQETRTVSGLNYGPIKYLRDRVLYANNGRTTAENMAEYESNLHRVTDADTYAAYLLSSYDVSVDETQVFCDLRRAFPSLTFAELCQLIRDHMGENQQGNGIAAALVPDVVILSSSDEYTRKKFRERHERFNKLSSYWKGKEVNTNRESDLKKHYDRESLAVHFLLSEELYYTWGEDRAARCLDSVREIYPDMTAQELRNIRDKYADAVSEIYD